MEKKKDHSMIYIGATVLLLAIAIAATSFINSRPSSGTDIRAKASRETGLKYEGVVGSVNPDNHNITVDGLQPIDSGMALSGLWTIQPPSDFPDMAAISPGVRIAITVDSGSFNIQTRTMGAKKIEVR